LTTLRCWRKQAFRSCTTAAPLDPCVGQPDLASSRNVTRSWRKDHGHRQGGRRAFSAFAERPEVGHGFHRREYPDSGQKRRPPHPCTAAERPPKDDCLQEASRGQLPLVGQRTDYLDVTSRPGGRLRGRPQPRRGARRRLEQHLQISSGDSRVGYTLAMTKGVLGDKSYEMTPIKDAASASRREPSRSRLSIPDAPKAMVVLAFRSHGADSRRRPTRPSKQSDREARRGAGQH